VSRDDLVEIFAGLGAKNPEQWADSQIEAGIPQLHRFVFLRQAWQDVIEPGNPHWIENLERGSGSTDMPVRAALQRVLAAGAEPADLGLVIRAMQRDMLFSLCYQLDNPGGIEPEVDGVSWGLFVTDADGDPVEPLAMLHESVIETDPLANEHDHP
jgi:hypothetical protein